MALKTEADQTFLHKKVKNKYASPAFGSYIHKPGQSIWPGQGYLTFKEIYLVNLLVRSKDGEMESVKWLDREYIH